MSAIESLPSPYGKERTGIITTNMTDIDHTSTVSYFDGNIPKLSCANTEEPGYIIHCIHLIECSVAIIIIMCICTEYLLFQYNLIN